MHSISRFRARLATVLSLRPLCFSVESSRSAGESDGLQIKGIAQNSCRTRFDAHSKRGTESSNPAPSSGESANHRFRRRFHGLDVRGSRPRTRVVGELEVIGR